MEDNRPLWQRQRAAMQAAAQEPAADADLAALMRNAHDQVEMMLEQVEQVEQPPPPQPATTVVLMPIRALRNVEPQYTIGGYITRVPDPPLPITYDIRMTLSPDWADPHWIDKVTAQLRMLLLRYGPAQVDERITIGRTSYRPARLGEPPDIWVSNDRDGLDRAPYVQMGY